MIDAIYWRVPEVKEYLDIPTSRFPVLPYRKGY